jgi:hypothetical protein
MLRIKRKLNDKLPNKIVFSNILRRDEFFISHIRRITQNGFDLVLYQYAGRETHSTIKLEAKNADIPFYGLADLLELLGTQMMKLEGYGIVIGIRIRIHILITPSSGSASWIWISLETLLIWQNLV